MTVLVDPNEYEQGLSETARDAIVAYVAGQRPDVPDVYEVRP